MQILPGALRADFYDLSDVFRTFSDQQLPIDIITGVNYNYIVARGKAQAGVAEQADAQDLKSCEAYPSYRFDPGLRHHQTMMQPENRETQ
jgi:hypothetical protein